METGTSHSKLSTRQLPQGGSQTLRWKGRTKSVRSANIKFFKSGFEPGPSICVKLKLRRIYRCAVHSVLTFIE